MARTKISLNAPLADEHLPEMGTLLDGSGQAMAGRNDWRIRRGRFESGLSAGVEVVELCNGPLKVFVLPTRGLGVWKADFQGLPVGWQSPVARPVHPHFVDLHGRNGLGWLDGFNELICRCGLSCNGPPGTDDGAKSPVESEVTLHGRIANSPARDVEVFVDDEKQEVGVTGVVEEAALFGPRLEMRSTITSAIGSDSFTIWDEVTNVGAEAAELQLLYHTNIGSPILEEGASVECPVEEVVPRDARAEEGIGHYATYLPPTTGYAEQVYYFTLLADAEGRSLALLKNRSGDKGVSVHFLTSQLPGFTLWKCTQAEQAGYVTGLEPGTGYPNFKAFERQQGRVIALPAGETYRTEVRMQIHPDAASVSQALEKIREIQGSLVPKIQSRPMMPYAPGEAG